MRLPEAEALRRLAEARVARLATVDGDRPHLVPVTYVLTGGTVTIAVDHKPKSTMDLRRLRNIAANPNVSLLADEYDEDWTRLWWVRVDGTAAVTAEPEPALVAKYPRYQQNPPAGPFIRVRVERVVGWAFSRT
ncbi:TIGR03668 family PPOX class F420-dependent oxidoreductase [Kibdelosporangium lantanae]